MGGDKRTVNGCWTCRLRKLKCDEGRRGCDRCWRQGISCDGYGEKPEWKDGRKKEAEKLAAVKAIIARRRRTASCGSNNASKSYAAPIVVSPTPGTYTEVVAMNHDVESNALESVAYTPFAASPHQGLTPFHDILANAPPEPCPIQSETREDELLMHYLDYVFYLQFRHYKYGGNFSSRSWLFSLVKRIRPLRHSVLSLSALHQHCLNRQALFGAPQDDILHELRNHHSSALSELQQFIHDQMNGSLSDGHIPILACCVQLISFDLFQGGKTDWQMHLQAASTLVKDHIDAIGPGSVLQQQFHEEVAFSFHTGAIVWFDILSSASTGKMPTLYHYHHTLLGSRPPLVSLENIMGCENSVMIFIGEIAVLREWKSNQMVAGTLSVWSLVEKARWVLDALERDIDRLTEILDLRSAAFTNSITTTGKDTQVYVVTNIFACAAVVYVHIIVCGVYPSLPNIRSAISRTITAMQRINEDDRGKLARSLVWPAVVAGCLADAEQQIFFRDFMTKGDLNAHGFGNCQTAKEVLETCWEHRQSSGADGMSGPTNDQLWDWSQAMEHLGYLLLLI